MKWFKKNKGSLVLGGGSRIYETPPELLIKRPPSYELNQEVSSFLEEFSNMQSELSKRYEISAKALFENEQLVSKAFYSNGYIVIQLKNSLIEKHFDEFDFKNVEKFNQMKKSFEKLGIVVTDFNDEQGFGICKSCDIDKRIILHIRKDD
ncbi:hypothetical protein BCAMP_12326 [Brochothrix campestris FSL F6-1037]|uniref:Uncharacterized protein n=2 Tax=Brochothrix campestris TaxID=2757 RepID=W7C487_9LIST|nr:hypothetical protein BCAMP_12326 [Brochothrix campestris FSL F6-1037]